MTGPSRASQSPVTTDASATSLMLKTGNCITNRLGSSERLCPDVPLPNCVLSYASPGGLGGAGIGDEGREAYTDLEVSGSPLGGGHGGGVTGGGASGTRVPSGVYDVPILVPTLGVLGVDCPSCSTAQGLKGDSATGDSKSISGILSRVAADCDSCFGTEEPEFPTRPAFVAPEIQSLHDRS